MSFAKGLKQSLEDKYAFSQPSIDQSQTREGQVRDEETNISSTFMKECLSKAIQWVSPELMLNVVPEQTVVKLEDLLYLKHESFKMYNNLQPHEKLELLLVEIKNKEFDVMKECMRELQPHNNNAVDAVWRLYNQYLNTDFGHILCVYCKIRCRVDIKYCSRYLYRQNIISDHLHKTIIFRRSKVGSQEDLWNDLEEECNKYHNPYHVLDAFCTGLVAQGDIYGHLIAELETWLEKENPTFICRCQESCSELFKPNDSTTKTVKDSLYPNSERDKENQVPKADPVTLECRHAKQKKKKNTVKCVDTGLKSDFTCTSRNYSERERHEMQKDPLLHGNMEESALASTRTDNQQPFNGHKRKVDRSTNIYNFYNKGPVNVGTNVLDMKPETYNNAQNYITDESESDTSTGNTIQRKTKLSLPAPDIKDETFAKRLKYNQTPLALTYPNGAKAQDSPTVQSSEDDSEYVSSKSDLMLTITNSKDLKKSVINESTVYDKSNIESNRKENQSQISFPDSKSRQSGNGFTESGKGARSFRRQKSAPSGY